MKQYLSRRRCAPASQPAPAAGASKEPPLARPARGHPARGPSAAPAPPRPWRRMARGGAPHGAARCMRCARHALPNSAKVLASLTMLSMDPAVATSATAAISQNTALIIASLALLQGATLWYMRMG